MAKVAKGQSILTKAGQKNEGDEITAAMLGGGQKALEALIEKGVCCSGTAKAAETETKADKKSTSDKKAKADDSSKES